jgi:uncharacterized protein YndB with AHSA1/START domain
MNGDSARISVAVAVPPDFAFRLFTEDIDRWWGTGRKYRQSDTQSSLIRLEPKLGGRLFESFERGGAPQVWEAGKVLVWEPPRRLSFSWRNANFTEHEQTHVDVHFESTRSGTLVTVTHSGFSSLRADHPARHGLASGEFLRLMGLWWGEQLTALRAYGERPPTD